MYQLQLFNSYKIGAQIRPSPVSRAEIQAKGEPGKNPAVAEPVTSQLEWRLWTAEMATVSEKVSGSHPGIYFLQMAVTFRSSHNNRNNKGFHCTYKVV